LHGGKYSHVYRVTAESAQQAVMTAVDGMDIYLGKSTMMFHDCGAQIAG
jgi:hypothetical protein